MKARLYKYIFLTIAAASMCLGYLVALKIRTTTTTTTTTTTDYQSAAATDYHIHNIDRHFIQLTIDAVLLDV